MDIKEIFNKIQVMFSKNLTPEEKQALKANIVKLNEQIAAPAPPAPAPVQLAEMKAKDGRVITVEGELKEGTSIMVVDPTNGPAPAEGDIEMEDGTIVTAVAGKVTMVKPVAAPVPEGEMVKQMEAKMSAHVKTIETNYSLKLSEQKTAFEKELSELKKQVLFNSQLIEKIIETPIDTIEFSEAKSNKRLTDEEYNKLSNADKVKYNRGKL